MNRLLACDSAGDKVRYVEKKLASYTVDGMMCSSEGSGMSWGTIGEGG